MGENKADSWGAARTQRLERTEPMPETERGAISSIEGLQGQNRGSDADREWREWRRRRSLRVLAGSCREDALGSVDPPRGGPFPVQLTSRRLRRAVAVCGVKTAAVLECSHWAVVRGALHAEIGAAAAGRVSWIGERERLIPHSTAVIPTLRVRRVLRCDLCLTERTILHDPSMQLPRHTDSCRFAPASPAAPAASLSLASVATD